MKCKMSQTAIVHNNFFWSKKVIVFFNNDVACFINCLHLVTVFEALEQITTTTTTNWPGKKGREVDAALYASR